MKAPRALIAEDEPLLAAELQALLQQGWPELQIEAVAHHGPAALALALERLPDLCFLDIRMPGMTGLEVARAMAEDWPHETPFPLLVFVTAYDHFALQAFEAQAVDYLIKPVTPPRLAQCLERLRARWAERAARQDSLQAAVDALRSLMPAELRPEAMPAPAAGKLEVLQAQVGAVVHLVPVEDVLYFEAADKYVRVVTAEREHLIRMPLRELLPRLDTSRFWQVHRGTVVQARHIAAARRDESGKVFLSLKGRTETLVASRLYAHLFKGM